MASRDFTHLRPRSIGELLDQAIRLYRKNFITYIGIIGVMQIPLVVLQVIVSFFTIGDTLQGGYQPEAQMASVLTGSVVQIIIGIASFVLINGVATAALTRAIADNYLGEDTGIIEAYNKIRGSWKPLIGGLFVVGMVSILGLIWCIVPIVGWFSGPGILIFLSVSVSSLIAPCVVLEKLSGASAFNRSWRLGMKRFWWLLIYFALLSALSYAVVNAPSSIISFFTQTSLQESLVAGDTFGYSLNLILQSLLSLVLSLLYFPLKSTGVILAYFDLRVRFEGFDLAVLAHQIDNQEARADDLTAMSLESGEKEKLLSGSNIGKLAAASFICIALYAVMIAFVIGISSSLPSFL